MGKVSDLRRQEMLLTSISRSRGLASGLPYRFGRTAGQIPISEVPIHCSDYQGKINKKIRVTGINIYLHLLCAIHYVTFSVW